jgi:PAB1-binding protein PBP1
MTSEQSEARYLLKMVKKVSSPNDKQVNGADSSDAYVGNGTNHAMTFAVRDVADFSAQNVRLDKNMSKAGQNGTYRQNRLPPQTPADFVLGASNFKTDTDISAGFAGRERDLQRWEGSLESAVDLRLDSSGKGWDQFETNERLYGVKTNYDESFYTTTIDKSHPDYKKREAEADRIAREIEGSTAMNAHVAEERGGKATDDNSLDEESK